MTKVTKKILAEKIAEANGLSKKEATDIINSAFDIAIEEIKAGNELYIDGLGKISTKEVEERMATNPRDPKGPKVKVAAHRKVTFKVAKPLKEALR